MRAAFFEEKSRRTEVSELAVAGSESEPTNAERAEQNECCLGESMNPMPLQISDLVAARRRAAMPSSVPRPLKSVGGRATPIPAHLRVTGVALSDDERVEIRRKLGMRSRFYGATRPGDRGRRQSERRDCQGRRVRSIDLIVMGVSGRGALDVALLGSTTHHVIREGAWPVLTVRTGKR